MKYNFCVYILSHGRADNVITYKTLKRQGYTGDIKILVDNEDKQQKEYIKKYGNKVRIFDKETYMKTTDTMDTFNRHDVVVYARNAVYDVAKEDGYKYICVLDDDYTSIEKRYEKDGKLKVIKPNVLDKVFEYAVDYLRESGAKCYAFAQGGDLIGGLNSGRWKNRVMRKIMNTYFFDVDKPVYFYGTLNEDMVASLRENMSGNLLLTSVDMTTTQKRTQKQEGGLTDAYLDYGTYVKSFYAVMMYPAAAKVAVMKDPVSNYGRIHHKVNYRNVAPMIISGKYKKKE